MDRRTFGASLFTGAVGLVAAPALGQGMMQGQGMAMQMGPAEQRHATETLQVGNVALLTSRMAQSRAQRPQVRQFADFEVEEQETVSRIINEMAPMSPPPPLPRDQAMMNRLQRARGAAFDRDYLMGQLDGHQRLLAIQDRYLSEGRSMHHRHIAMLARGRIQEHIQDVQRMMRMA